MNINTTKMNYVRIDGWRGYNEPVNAVGGCNDTGMWSDSPCRSDIANAEIDSFIAKLKKEKIRYRKVSGNSSNVFMGKIFVCVHADQRLKAQEIAFKHLDETRLFYNI